MIVFVSGATAGIGLATTRRFLEDGARVIATGRRAGPLAELRAEFGPLIHTAVLDVRDRSAVEAVVAALPESFSAVDVLVNNAGLALGLEAAQEARLDDWDAVIDTNVKGVVYLTRAIIGGMVARDRGTIVNLGSVAGTYPYPGGNVYGATKAFVAQFSLNLRADLLGTRIRVTDIEPGMCSGTEFSAVRFRGDTAKADAVYAGMTPLSPEDIADTIHWVATRPTHVNINRLELMPVDQAFGPFSVHRR